MVRKKYEVHNLDCAHCASKIEHAVAQLEGVGSANLDFVTRSFVVTVDEEHAPSLQKNIEKIIAKMEPDAKLVVPEQEGKPEKHSGSWVKYLLLGLAAAAFAAGLICSYAGVPTLVYAMIFAAATLLGGYETLLKGINSLVHLQVDENLLMTIAVVAAFALGDFPEAAGVALLFCVGEMFEERAVDRSRKDIEALAQIQPTEAAKYLPDGSTKVVPAEEVQVDDVIAVRPFERVPLDGVVLEGHSNVDTAALTGESVPLEAGKGTQLLSGMVNGETLLKVKVTSRFENSAASRIIAMVQDAASRKGSSEKFITRFARVYTPIVVVLAILLAVLPPLFGMGAFTEWLQRALVFLVASCPCALVISVPLGFFSGIGAASKQGVLVKGGKYVELLSKADAAVFDKTGTITSGQLQVTEAVSFDDSYASDDLVKIAAAAERYSTHPVAQAICRAAGETGLTGEAYNERPGYGVEAKVDGKQVAVGARRMLTQLGIDDASLPEASVYVAVNGQVKGAIQVRDTLREDAAGLTRDLKEQGVKRLVMLTGDAEPVAKEIAAQAGIPEFHAGLLPQDKVRLMEEIRSQSGTTVFVGDGINDAPVLAAADVGVAMGLGSDAAIEAADVVLVENKPSRLAGAIQLFKKVMRVVRFNIVFALAIKAAVLVLAAFGMAPMWAAVLADTGVALLAVLNSARLLKCKL
ncbi:heavy metal translocating P-type ATPase [Solibaculum intestinale]|uniref:Cd(2+)-exporting ATPase n=1 Tax=Solibaculum intestinale TaxID=3133165 RepID=A0ABV1E121_9FIRM